MSRVIRVVKGKKKGALYQFECLTCKTTGTKSTDYKMVAIEREAHRCLGRRLG